MTYQRAKTQLTEGKSPDELNFVVVASKASKPEQEALVGKVWDRKAGQWVDFKPTKNILIPGRARCTRRGRDGTTYWRWGSSTATKVSMQAMSGEGLWVGVRTVADFKEEQAKREKEKSMVQFHVTPAGLAQGIVDEDLSLLSDVFYDNDPRPAAAQIDTNYAHGGGYNPTDGFTLNADNSLSYPGDEPLKVLAKATLRDEQLYLYDGEFVAVVQPDRSFAVTRMD